MITLYIKTHRITGLKYFGYTTRKDVDQYKGSGIYWRQHIKKHGNDANTEIVAVFENIDEASSFAINFSKENNIVKSDEWANLMEEDCRGMWAVSCGRYTQHKGWKCEKMESVT